MKNDEQWCFSIRKTDERLLTTVFQQREENERFAGVSAMGKICCARCCSRGRGKTKQVLDGVVSGVRMMGKRRAGIFL